MGLKLENSIFNINYLENDQCANTDVKDMAEDFHVNFWNLADNFVNKLSNPSDKYGLLSIGQ